LYSSWHTYKELCDNDSAEIRVTMSAMRLHMYIRPECPRTLKCAIALLPYVSSF